MTTSPVRIAGSAGFRLAAPLLALLPLLFVANYAHSQSKAESAAKHPIDAAFDACQAKASTTPAIAGCYIQARDAWDKEMNKQYTLLKHGLPAPAQAKLLASQRVWLKYRDAEEETLSAVYGSRDGTIQRIHAASTDMEITRQRASLLRGYNSDNESY